MERASRTPTLAWTILLGFGLGGFFDGVILHQILQWHHLLSLWNEAGDLRWHVLWDGVFHVLMYGITGLALWGLWRRGVPRGRRFPAAALLGFGLWNLVDLVVFHWLLEVHHIRIEAAEPLLYDLGWFVVFGLAPLVAGWVMLRKSAPR